MTFERKITIIGHIATAVTFAFCVGVMATSCVDGMVRTSEIQEQHYSAPLTSEQEEYHNFFRKHGSPAPEKMAVAVSKTKRPALMAALAVRESNGNPAAVGDGGKARGAFQVWTSQTARCGSGKGDL